MGLTVTYIGGPTLLIEVGGFRILTDPTFDPPKKYAHLEKVRGPALAQDQIGTVDAILLSHDQHADNFDDAGRDFSRRAPRIVTTMLGAQRLGGAATGLEPWASDRIHRPDGASLTITATPARHGPPGIEPHSGPVIGFVLSAAGRSAPTIYISGDTVWYEGVAEVASRWAIDVAILHLGDAHVAMRGPDRLTMNAEEGVLAAQALRPRAIIPVHYEGWTHFTEPKARAQQILTDAATGSRVYWLAPGISTRI